MAVRVFMPGGTSIDINDGDTWTHRSDGHLEVFDRRGGEVAEFVAGQWAAVIKLLEVHP